jgi:chromosome partitioning protein
LTLNALAVADEILIPVQPHFLALQGFGKLLQTVDLVSKRINPSLKVKWILLCIFDSRVSLSSEVKADIEQFLTAAKGSNCAWAGAEILPVAVRRNIKLAEAPSYGRTIFEYDSDCNGALDYRRVAEYIHTGKLSNATEEIEKCPIKIIEIAHPNQQAPAINTEIKENKV